MHVIYALSDMVREDVQVVRVLLAYGRQLQFALRSLFHRWHYESDEMIDFLA